MSNLLEAIVEHQQAAAKVFDEKVLPAINAGDGESAKDFMIETVRTARPALRLIEILKLVHGEEKEEKEDGLE